MKTKILKTIGKIFKFIGKWALRKLAFLGIFAALTIGGISSCVPSFGAPKVATVSAYAETVTPAQVSDLTGTTWEFDSDFDIFIEDNNIYSLTFYSNGNVYDTIGVYPIDMGVYSIEYETDGTSIEVYSQNGWINQAYRYIEVLGGADVTNVTLITWLEDNATLISGGGGGGEPDIPEGVYYWSPDNPFAAFESQLPSRFAYTYDIQTEYNGNIFDNITLGRNEQGYYIYANREGFSLRVFQLGVWNAAFDDWRDAMVVTEDYYYTPSVDAPQIGFDIITAAIISSDDEPQTDGEAYWYRVGYDEGYDEGYDFGYNEGYRNGYYAGQAESGSIGQSIWNGLLGFIRALFNEVIRLLSVEIVPSINIALVTIGIPMVFWAIGAIIRLVTFFFGGGGS